MKLTLAQLSNLDNIVMVIWSAISFYLIRNDFQTGKETWTTYLLSAAVVVFLINYAFRQFRYAILEILNALVFETTETIEEAN